MKKSNMDNKYFFFKAGSIIFELAKRNKIPLSMAIVDIDNLKLLNEKYGRDISDKLINSVNKTLMDKCRKSDLVSYLGEGRFGLLLYNISGINTDMVLNAVRKKIAYNRYKVKEDTFNITASIGAIVIHPQMSKETLEEIYDKAYLATNAAKEKGKDCVVVY